MNYKKILIWSFFLLITLVSVAFFLIRNIEQEIQKIKSTNVTEVSKKIKPKDQDYLIFTKEIVTSYGADLVSSGDDTLVLYVIKKNLASGGEEAIYRIKKYRTPPTEVQIRNQDILIKRNFKAGDNILVDLKGNDVSSFTTQSEISEKNGVFSKNNQYYAYSEKLADWQIGIYDFKKKEVLVPTFDFEQAIESEISVLGFSPDENYLFIKYTNGKDDQVVTSHYVYDIKNEEFKELDNLDKQGQITDFFFGDNDSYFSVMNSTESGLSFSLNQIEMTAASGVNGTTIFSTREKINKLIEKRGTRYIQVGNNIYSMDLNNELSSLIEDAELLDLDTNQNTLIYKKHSTLNDTESIFKFDIESRTSTEIYQNKISNYGELNYATYQYVGIVLEK